MSPIGLEPVDAEEEVRLDAVFDLMEDGALRQLEACLT